MVTEPSRYDRIAIALHWLIGLALLGQIAFGFSLDAIAPRNTPARSAVINLHKSCGVVLGTLIFARVLWRLRHRPPPWPATMLPWQRRAAEWAHRGLYACMVVMPVAGFTASNFSKHGLKFFGIAMRPWGPDLPGVYAFFNGVHVATAFVFTTLIALHVAAAFKHLLLDRDDVFSRIWPWSRPDAPALKIGPD